LDESQALSWGEEREEGISNGRRLVTWDSGDCNAEVDRAQPCSRRPFLLR
jgi:hypothetical protein